MRRRAARARRASSTFSRREGVVVRRPDDHRLLEAFCHTANGGRRASASRARGTGILVLGDEILETPMPWRSRYFEMHAYRPLLKEYWSKRARAGVAAPTSAAAATSSTTGTIGSPGPRRAHAIRHRTSSSPSSTPPTSSAAARDLFVTAQQRDERVGHRVAAAARRGALPHPPDPRPGARTPCTSIRAFMPIAPGKVLVNPDYVDTKRLPTLFKSWDILVAPRPDPISRWNWRTHVSMVQRLDQHERADARPRAPRSSTRSQVSMIRAPPRLARIQADRGCRS